MTDSDLANNMAVEDLSLGELRMLHGKYFHLGHINGSITDRFTLVTLVAYVTRKLSKKDPTINCYKVLRKIVGPDFNDTTLKGIAVNIESLSYAADPSNLGLTDKQVIDTIKRLMDNWMPF